MVEQGSLEWFAERCGRVTASRIVDVMAKKTTAARANYAAQLMTERLTGTTGPSFTNAAMEWGTETEPQARAMYSFIEGIEVEETGFHVHPQIERSGASPDGLAGDGLVEIKCPNSNTHFNTLLGKKIDRKYIFQMQWQMACCPEKQWCDFVSFDPRLTPAKQYFCQRIERDDELIDEIEVEVRQFLAEIDENLAKLEAEYPEQKEV
jgi:putative phage-type endonuclease